jgi:hypothetical protein
MAAGGRRTRVPSRFARSYGAFPAGLGSWAKHRVGSSGLALLHLIEVEHSRTKEKLTRTPARCSVADGVERDRR